MSLSPLDRPGQWTFDNLTELADDDRRYEVVDGVLVAMTPPTHLPDRIVKLLDRQLDPQLPPQWGTLTEAGVRLGTDGRRPDLAVVRTDVPFERERVETDPELFVVTHELREGAYAATAVLRGQHLVAPFGMTLDVPALLPLQLRD